MTGNTLDAPSANSADTQEARIQTLESAISPYDDIEPIGQTMAWLSQYLKPIDPVTSGANFLRVVNAVHKKLGGDNDGIELLHRWSIKGSNERSQSDIEAIWCSLKSTPDKSNTTESIVNPVDENADIGLASSNALEAQPQPVDTNTLVAEPQPKKIARAVTNALDQYTVNGQLQEIERRAVEQKPILGRLVLMGQATMFYAAPNTGKTLIAFALAIDGIKKGLIDPANLYFINNDDTTNGLAEKLRIAEEYGFKMLAETYQDFDAPDLQKILSHMVEHDQANNIIAIIDTATKVVNVLDATKTRAFTKVIRKFVLKGGTIIALAHANKNPGADGKPVYRGTTDIINDFDCAYVLSQLQADAGEKIVVFENRKRRGNVPQSAAFSYSNEPGISYHELLASVKEIDEDKIDSFKQVEAMRSDAELIAAVTFCIQAGVNTKMLLADAVAERAGISKRAAIKAIERYTGDDPAIHRWNFSVRERGAKVFELLETTLALPDAKSTPAP